MGFDNQQSLVERDAQTRERTRSLLAERQQQLSTNVDRVFMWLMAAQWIFGIVLAVAVSPWAWAGRTSSIHAHVWAAVVLGGALSALPILLTKFQRGAPINRFVVASAQMLWSGLLIHLTGGRIETHFHVFGSLAFLAFYRDWRVFVPATLIVASDHLIRQLFWPESVYGVAVPEFWRFLEHAGWVLFEDVFLVIGCVLGTREMERIAEQQARIEIAQKLELAIATRIQTSILPRRTDLSGLDLSAAMVTASEVGGDYYDVLPTKDGGWIAIGDVSGHGLAAGLVMLQAQSAIGALLRRDPFAQPREVLAQANRLLFDNVRGRMGLDDYMTLSLVRYFEDGRLVVAGAHEDILIYRARTNTCEHFETRGSWLAGRADIQQFLVDSELRMEQGDVVVLYTDGATEAMNAAREQLGPKRLAEELRRVHNQSVPHIRDHLLKVVREWSSRQQDDVTLLVFRYHGVAKPSFVRDRDRGSSVKPAAAFASSSQAATSKREVEDAPPNNS